MEYESAIHVLQDIKDLTLTKKYFIEIYVHFMRVLKFRKI